MANGPVSAKKRERTLWPEAKKSMSDPNNIWKAAVFLFAAGGVWAVLNQTVQANADDLVEVTERVKTVETKVKKIELSLIDQERRDVAQTKTINWIGLALEKMASAQNIKLPQRPLIQEEQ